MIYVDPHLAVNYRLNLIHIIYVDPNLTRATKGNEYIPTKWTKAVPDLAELKEIDHGLELSNL